MEKSYNYIKILSTKNEPLYILKVEAGSQDELLLVEMLFANKVNFDKSDGESFQRLVEEGSKQYSITGQDILDEAERRENPPPREGRDL